MNEVLDIGESLMTWANSHRNVLILVGLAITVLLLALTVRRAIKSGQPDRWLARLSFLVGFAWSGEAMWEVATQRLHLSHVFAGFAFFLFESQMATAMMRAERHQALHHHPGKHGRSVWLIATIAGAIAAMAGDSPVETVLRLVVPLLVAHQWWVGLTGDGTDRPADAITWTWTPRRILVTLGLARAGEHDLTTVNRERHVRAIAAISYRLHSTPWSWRRTWCHARLRRLAMHADDEMLEDARARVERVWQAAARTRPADTADQTLAAVSRKEAEVAAAEAEAARMAEAEAVSWAQAAGAHAEAEASRRVALEAEVEVHRAQAEAEAEGRAKAEAEAEAARVEAREAELRASRLHGHAEAAEADAQRRAEAAEAAVAQALQARDEEQRRRHEAEATATATDKAMTREARRRQAAEADGRRRAEAYTALEAEAASLREQLSESQARGSRRVRPRTSSPREQLTLDGVPIPEVTGVGPATVLEVLRARQAHPDDTQKQLAERVQVSDRTVRLVLAAVERSALPAGV
ncbi:hypothetical protein KZZ52_41750 [Dactylosporangium sp. AC04546]|uniref:hypothetical protein n=1 Tax=Dactylosporangium sp. AC04546 TaxID=2862460 RepID=UPI001EDFDDDC|nr:hypothetical protein [Dactylosporangium sp. AC04546]WVK80451.1 hypothetical protein KZZ52_41750 [Dactylosporangium sp. AC04546]